MNANQFEPYIKGISMEAHRIEKEQYETFLRKHLIGKMLGIGAGNQEVEAFRDATFAAAALVHKIHIAFTHGYFAVEDEVLGTEEERTKLYREITEYISPVESGIDSFLETHPIKAVAEGGADDEEQ